MPYLCLSDQKLGKVVHFALQNHKDAEFTARHLEALASLGWKWPSRQTVDYSPFMQRGGRRPGWRAAS